MPVINAAGKTLIKISVDDAICKRCRRCFGSDICKGKAFRVFDRADAPFIDMSRCWGCLKCIPACPFGAIIKSDYSEPAAEAPSLASPPSS